MDKDSRFPTIPHQTCYNPLVDEAVGKPWCVCSYPEHPNKWTIEILRKQMVNLSGLRGAPDYDVQQKYVIGGWGFLERDLRTHQRTEELAQPYGGYWFNQGRILGPVFPTFEQAYAFIDEVLDPLRIMVEMCGEKII